MTIPYPLKLNLVTSSGHFLYSFTSRDIKFLTKCSRNIIVVSLQGEGGGKDILGTPPMIGFGKIPERNDLIPILGRDWRRCIKCHSHFRTCFDVSENRNGIDPDRLGISGGIKKIYIFFHVWGIRGTVCLKYI